MVIDLKSVESHFGSERSGDELVIVFGDGVLRPLLKPLLTKPGFTQAS
jgi:hypothetical protein